MKVPINTQKMIRIPVTDYEINVPKIPQLDRTADLGGSR